MNPPTKFPWELLGEEFVKAYYQHFDTNREQLLGLYAPAAMLTFEEQKAQGVAGIKEILMKLKFTNIAHHITKIDCQPTEGGVLILVNGRVKTDNDPPHSFSQTFYIKEMNGSYFLMHDIFRLSIHDI